MIWPWLENQYSQLHKTYHFTQYCKNLLTINETTMLNKCISQTRKELESYATYEHINGKAIAHLET